MNHESLCKLLGISFEAILQGGNQHDQPYSKHHTILNFLAETTTVQSYTREWLLVDFY